MRASYILARAGARWRGVVCLLISENLVLDLRRGGVQRECGTYLNVMKRGDLMRSFVLGFTLYDITHVH